MVSPKKTPIEPSLVARISRGLRYAITGDEGAWFGPVAPLEPVAQEPEAKAKGRAFDYDTGINMRQRPKQGEGVAGATFDDLRALADNYDLVRLCIETRKDQMCGFKIDFQNVDKSVEDDPRIEELTRFFRFPDKEHDWNTWLRIVLEDLLVIDAPCLFPRATMGGGLYALEPVDGASIKRVIDATGRTPMPPLPAYQQVLKGMPAVDYTSEELIYRPRNMRSYRLYGFSPVEQIITTINIAMRRQLHQLSYFTEGNIPDAIFGVPETWTPEQIKQFQDWWDSITTRQSKSKGRFVPGGINPIDTKAMAMQGKDDQVMNEWLARVVCYCFNVTPTQLIQANNKATSESQASTADDDGLKPIKIWVKSLMDYIIHFKFGYHDIEFVFADEVEMDPLKRAQIHQIYLNANILEDDEVRSELGKEPFTSEQRERMAANALVRTVANNSFGSQPEGEDGSESGGEEPSSKDKDKGKEEESEEKEKQPPQPVIGKLEIHMPPITTGDTLIEMAPTTIKAHFSDGKITEARVDNEG